MEIAMDSMSEALTALLMAREHLFPVNSKLAVEKLKEAERLILDAYKLTCNSLPDSA